MKSAATLVALSMLAHASPLFAQDQNPNQDLFVYPNEGQSEEQTRADRTACESWAARQTGFDPVARAAPARPPALDEAPQAGLVSGAARGAVAGASVGVVRGRGRVAKQAAVGAAAGGVVGGMRHAEQRRQREHARGAADQQQREVRQSADQAWMRANIACLEGRGYTVR